MKKTLIPATVVLIALTIVLATGLKAWDDHDDHPFEFKAGTLVLSRSVYSAPANLLTPGVTVLPPGCVPNAALSVTCAVANADATYPTVWDNDTVDASFGMTSPILLDNITLDGHTIDTLRIPTDRVVTSFSSKSEMGLNRSLDGKSITFMAYVAPVNTIDVSNSNTVGVVDPSNPVVGKYNRSVTEVDDDARMHVTETYAYSGNNGRAAIKADWMYYTVGNSNNGSTNPVNVTSSTGVELVPPYQAPLAVPEEIGSLSLIAGDKAGKETNFRGLTIFGNTLYVTKGSGSNGVNTVYQVGTAGTLPTVQNAPSMNLSLVPITILPGFPTAAARNNPTARYPFGIWFADANTLYVADEGDGCTSNSKTCPNVEKTATTACSIACSVYANAASQTGAGLEKWVRDPLTGVWSMVYTLQAGLGLGAPYVIPDYPTGTNAGTGLPWAPATDGLRNLTGKVNKDGTVTLWAITSTISGSGDQGADPNRLVTITDVLSAKTLPAVLPGDGDHDRDDSHEQFVTLRTARSGEVLRGIIFAPSDHESDNDKDHGHDDHGRK